MFKTNRTIPRNHTTTYAFSNQSLSKRPCNWFKVAKRETKLGIKINGNEFFLEANYNRYHFSWKSYFKNLYHIHLLSIFFLIFWFNTDLEILKISCTLFLKRLASDWEYINGKKLRNSQVICQRNQDYSACHISSHFIFHFFITNLNFS